jgi:hypothetical protein
MDLWNHEPSNECFVDHLHIEFINVDYSNVKTKLFNYCMTYMALSIFLIYAMVFEYVKIT